MPARARFPGLPVICDGSEAIASVETRISEGACSYPITPSTTMPAVYQAAVADGRTNLWGTPLAFLEPESEHSSATAAEGFALAGGRVVNFTAGQGLILMKEVLYVIAGKRLPVVFHVGARALTSQSLNIHAGHDDVMGVADCGWGMLFARNVQEAADFTAAAPPAAPLSAKAMFDWPEQTHTSPTSTSRIVIELLPLTVISIGRSTSMGLSARRHVPVSSVVVDCVCPAADRVTRSCGSAVPQIGTRMPR